MYDSLLGFSYIGIWVLSGMMTKPKLPLGK